MPEETPAPAASRARWPSRVRDALAWGVAFSPAIFLLCFILPRRVPVPYHDSWVFVKQYENWREGHYSWMEFFAPHNMHPSAAGKAVYFAVMQWFRGDVGLLPLVTWALALIVSLSVLALSRPLWRGSVMRGAGLMFLVNLSSFTLAQGHTWIWDFVFQNAISGACLMLGLWLLGVERFSWWRWVAAMLAGVVATFSFGTGFAVGFLLLPAVWFSLGGECRKHRWSMMAASFAITLAGAWLALRFFVPSGASVAPSDGAGRVNDLIERPWDALRYVLALFGHTLGQGTSFEPVTACSLLGALILIVFIACTGWLVARRDMALLRAAWPWVAMGLWSALNAVAICLGRWRVSLDTALAPRYGQFMLFIVIGVMTLTLLVSRHGAGLLSRILKKLLVPGAAVLVVFQLLAWRAGWGTFLVYETRMEQERAALVFTDALPPQPGVLWQLDDSDGTAKLARFLKNSGKLRDIRFVQDAAISRWRMGNEISDKWARWELLRHEDGSVEMSGTAGLSKDLTALPDLVLVTATTATMPETIVALVAPEIPDDFYERALYRRSYYGRYFGWHWKVDPKVLPQGAEVRLQAFAFDRAGRKVRRINGIATLPPSGR